MATDTPFLRKSPSILIRPVPAEAPAVEARPRLLAQWKKAFSSSLPKSKTRPESRTTPISPKKRRIEESSIADSPHWYQAEAERDTVLYLAYGSNLAFEKFQGARGINPLSQVNVVVPELSLTFNLPGIPYCEPCFANSARRDPNGNASNQDYRKNRWHKGLVGVVYEVTREDYTCIIATEGGGSSYQDIFVSCHPLIDDRIVPEHPSNRSFAAHTLFAPPGTDRIVRPDPSYAQASARYLKFFIDGAEQHSLPSDYKEYLQQLRPYRITTWKQKVGSSFFLSIWIPFLLFLFSAQRFLAGKDGRSPTWLAWLSNTLMRTAWLSYDSFLLPVFGDGERSIPDGGKATVLSRKCESHGRDSEAEGELIEKTT